MKLDGHHEGILRGLSQHGQSSYNQLWASLEMPKRTFHKKIYELVRGNLIERDPPSDEGKPTPHKGRVVKFRLTQSGEKRIGVQDFLDQFEIQHNSILNRVIERSREVGQRKPLTGSTFFVISQSLPICTIAHLPSKEQYEKLKDKIPDESIRKELGKLINTVVEFYTENANEGLYGTEYLTSKNAVFFMGFLPTKETTMIQDLVNEGLFENETTMTRTLVKCLFQIVPSIHRRMKESRTFREGKEGVEFRGCFYYDADTLSIRSCPDRQ